MAIRNVDSSRHSQIMPVYTHHCREGTCGISPSEGMHGMKPKLACDETSTEIDDLIKGTSVGSKAQIEATARGRQKSLKLIREARTAYHAQLDKEMAKVTPSRSLKIGDIVRVAQHERTRRLRKVPYSKTGKQVIVRNH